VSVDLEELERLARKAITYADWDLDMLDLITAIRARDGEMARLRLLVQSERAQADVDALARNEERDSLRRQHEDALNELARLRQIETKGRGRFSPGWKEACLTAETERDEALDMLAMTTRERDEAKALLKDRVAYLRSTYEAYQDTKVELDRILPVFNAACAWRDGEYPRNVDMKFCRKSWPRDAELIAAVDDARKAGVK